MEAKYCAITVLFRFSPEISPKKAKNTDLNGFFGLLIPFLKTDAVLDDLTESIKVKFVGSHNFKKQLFYCLVYQISSPKIRFRTLRMMLYKFNAEIGRHPAILFIVMHLKERNLQRRFWLFRSLPNSYDKSFSQKYLMPLG